MSLLGGSFTENRRRMGCETRRRWRQGRWPPGARHRGHCHRAASRGCSTTVSTQEFSASQSLGGGSLSPKSFVSGPLHTSAPSAGGVLDGSLNLGVGGLARGVWTREAAVLGGRCCPLVMHPKVTGKPWERREISENTGFQEKAFDVRYLLSKREQR